MGFYLHFAGQAELAVEHLELAPADEPSGYSEELRFLRNGLFYERQLRRISRQLGGSAHERPCEPNAIHVPVRHLFDARDARGSGSHRREAPQYLTFVQPFGLALIRTYQSEADRARLYEAAKKAGIPEHSEL